MIPIPSLNDAYEQGVRDGLHIGISSVIEASANPLGEIRLSRRAEILMGQAMILAKKTEGKTQREGLQEIAGELGEVIFHMKVALARRFETEEIEGIEPMPTLKEAMAILGEAHNGKPKRLINFDMNTFAGFDIGFASAIEGRAPRGKAPDVELIDKLIRRLKKDGNARQIGESVIAFLRSGGCHSEVEKRALTRLQEQPDLASYIRQRLSHIRRAENRL